MVMSLQLWLSTSTEISLTAGEWVGAEWRGNRRPHAGAADSQTDKASARRRTGTGISRTLMASRRGAPAPCQAVACRLVKMRQQSPRERSPAGEGNIPLQ